MEGFIQLHRQMLDWEWYNDTNTKVLFLHLLLKANWKDKKWRGLDVKRGTFVTGRIILSEETGLSQQQVRTSLEKLKSTSEITIKSTNRNSIITILNYDKYQGDNQQSTTQPTNNQPTDNQQITTTNKDNNSNNEINIKESKELSLKPITTDINNLIQELKQQADILGIAYDKNKERMFAKHIMTTKEYGSFCEKVGMTRIEFAKNIMKASDKIGYWKGTCSGPMSIYQNYSEVYNQTKTKSESSKIVKIETLDGWD